MSSRRRSAVPKRRSAKGCIIQALVAIVVAFTIVAIAVVAGGWWIFYRPATDVAKGQPVQVEVLPGSNTQQIAQLLSSKGVVGNPNMFRLQSRLNEADGKLRAGVYELSTGMPYDMVLDKLKQGPPIDYVTVTIPEGFILTQIAARYEKQAGIPAEEFLALAEGQADSFAGDYPYLADTYKNSLEGYLFPKTYRVKEGATAREVIAMMLAQFDEEISSAGISVEGNDELSLKQIVVLGSMIERETKVSDERAKVSSVIYNRLHRGMRLEIDATIEYVLPGNRFRLRYSDLRLDSPYNTYLNKGLPPGPISNPGIEALKAAAAPADTQYIYYVLTSKDGRHTFATNERDFLTAKRKSKEVFGR